MPLRAGETIEVVRRGPAGGWSKGLTGAFPADFVEYLPAPAPVASVSMTPAISTASGNTGSLLDFTSTTTPATSSIGSSSFVGLGVGTAKTSAVQDKFDAFADLDSTAALSTSNTYSTSTSSNFAASSQSSSVASSAQTMTQTATSTYVSTTTTSSTETAAVKPVKPKVLAAVKYARISQGPTELSISVGDIVEVLKQDSEWWYGSLGEGSAKKTGFFPGNYVQIRDESTTPVANPTVSQSSSAMSYVADPYPTAASGSTSSSFGSGSGSAGMDYSEAPSSRSQPSVSNIRLPRRAVKEKVVAEMSGQSFALDSITEGAEKSPIWHLPLFLDLFADEYKSSIIGEDSSAKTSAIGRLKYALYIVKTALHRVNVMDQIGEGVPDVLLYAIKVINEGYETTLKVPAGNKDPTRFFTFLTAIMARIRSLQESESTIIPTSWTLEDGTEQGILVVVTRTHDGTGTDFSLAVVNTGCGDKGLQYHASNVDTADGSILRNIAFELCNIPNDKIVNTAFW